ncbi:MAG: hypothetical protein AAFU79_20415 [Myxococcota bacterium]
MLRWRAGLGAAVALTTGCVGAQDGTDAPPKTSEIPLVAIGASLPTEGGHFRVSARPVEPPVQVGRMQSWIVEIRDPKGRPANGLAVRLDGGMPQHGHGLPTAPRV